MTLSWTVLIGLLIFSLAALGLSIYCYLQTKKIEANLTDLYVKHTSVTAYVDEQLKKSKSIPKKKFYHKKKKFKKSNTHKK